MGRHAGRRHKTGQRPPKNHGPRAGRITGFYTYIRRARKRRVENTNMASTRRLWAENLHAYVFVGEFVHVKETAGWDAGKLKVYQVRSIDRDEQILRVVYWEQPQHKSALKFHYARGLCTDA